MLDYKRLYGKKQDSLAVPPKLLFAAICSGNKVLVECLLRQHIPELEITDLLMEHAAKKGNEVVPVFQEYKRAYNQRLSVPSEVLQAAVENETADNPTEFLLQQDPDSAAHITEKVKETTKSNVKHGIALLKILQYHQDQYLLKYYKSSSSLTSESYDEIEYLNDAASDEDRMLSDLFEELKGYSSTQVGRKK